MARGWAWRGRSAGKEPPWFKKKNPRPPGPSSQQPASCENLSPCLAQSIESRSDLKKKKKTGVVSFSGPCLCVCASSKIKLLGWAMPARHGARWGEPSLEGAARGNKDKGRACRQPRGLPETQLCHVPHAGGTLQGRRWASGALPNSNPPQSGKGGCVLGCSDLSLSLVSGPQAMGEQRVPREGGFFNPGGRPMASAQCHPFPPIRHCYGSPVDPEKKPPTFCRGAPAPPPTSST